MIIPNKEILYAPMLGTLGGGSARGFGRYAGGGIKLVGEPSKLFAVTNNELAYYDIQNSLWGSNPSATNSNVYSDGNFPATLGDVALDDEGTPWLYVHGGSRFRCAKVNDISVWNEQDLGLSNVRAMVTLRNNVIVLSDNSGNALRSYTLNNNGTLTHRDTYSTSGYVQNVETMISPPNWSGSTVLNSTNNTLGAYNGIARLVLYSKSNGIKEFSVSETGSIGFVQEYSINNNMMLNYWPNGYIVAGLDSGNFYLLDENLSYVTQSTSSAGSIMGGIAMARNGRFYNIEHNYRVAQHNLWNLTGTGSTSYQAALNVQSAFSGNSTNTPDYGNCIIAIDDHLYWSGYTSGNGWTFVRRVPTGNINMTNYSGANSGTQGGSYMTSLISGRPRWANTDEHFVLGTLWQ